MEKSINDLKAEVYDILNEQKTLDERLRSLETKKRAIVSQIDNLYKVEKKEDKVGEE